MIGGYEMEFNKDTKVLTSTFISSLRNDSVNKFEQSLFASPIIRSKSTVKEFKVITIRSSYI